MTWNPVSGVPVFVGPNIRRSTLGTVCDACDGVGESRYQRALIDQWRVGIVSWSKVEIARIAQLHLDLATSIAVFPRVGSFCPPPAVTRFIVRVLYRVEIAVDGIVVRFREEVALYWAAPVPPFENYVPVSRCASGLSGIAIKLILGDVKVNTVICKGKVIVDLVLVALEAEATSHAIKNHVVMRRFLDAARVPVESDAVVRGHIVNPVTANHDVVGVPIHGNAACVPCPVGVINMIKLYGVVRTGAPHATEAHIAHRVANRGKRARSLEYWTSIVAPK